MKKKRLPLIFEGCRRRDLAFQKELYELFYRYTIKIALHYAPSLEDAREIVNDVFLKVFNRIEEFDETQEFKPWINRITVCTAIDYYRKYIKNEPHYDNLESVTEVKHPDDLIAQIHADDLCKLVQNLSPAYRAAINLYAIEGFEHHEIAETLGISVGASKSNLFKARAKLKNMLYQKDPGNKASEN